MRLLQRSSTGAFSLTEDLRGDDTIPPYAILSHTWEEGQEVTFQDIRDRMGQDKTGYDKIRFCGQQAEHDGLQYFWVDTCCIDKSNYVELQEAINSMFYWYRNAAKCYVYLPDVLTKKENNKVLKYDWEPAFRRSKWFTRGWTLQELLAPTSVEFFSQEWDKLGDKQSLRKQIHEITRIPDAALKGAPLSQFSDKERFSWIQCRQTKVDEDKAYSLLGIFDVEMTLRYGEGSPNAFKRLEDEIYKLNKCLRDLHSTNPCNDKKRIEDTKGGLLKDSYRWILENSEFQHWRNDQQSRVLWIKGDPGKGKTMLLCGIVNELKESLASTTLLTYFFCQATDSRINNATAILRGLLYLLICQKPSLVSHIQKKYDHAGKALFEDANAWVALSRILTDVLQDLGLNDTYLIIDALDECVTGLSNLLGFIIQTARASSHIKWIVSSRNWPNIEEYLEKAGHKVKLSLELNASSVSTAVYFYIKQKVAQLAQVKSYREKEKSAVLAHLVSNANDTFLWVALVCQNLVDIPRWKVLAKLKVFPPGLDALYNQMMQQINSSDDASLCKRILALITVVYRPITLDELTYLDEGLEDMADDLDSVRQIVGLCGSFLTIRDGSIYFVHQSAKEFLSTKVNSELFPRGIKEIHHLIFLRSLQVMSKTLRRDLYSLGALGYSTELVEQPNPDPLAALRYFCIYWIDHLCDCNASSSSHYRATLQDGGDVESFLREKYLYWLEALSLCKSMSKGVVSMAKLEALANERAATSSLTEIAQDTRRFIMYHKWVIENSPLQKEEPSWIIVKPAMQEKWSPCFQTLEGHSAEVHSIAFSHDSAWLASGSYNGEVKIWDSSSGECFQTLEGHNDKVSSVAFSHDSAWLASGSYDGTVKIWNTSGECFRTLEGHSSKVSSVAFSHDSAWLASGSWDGTVKIWGTSNGECFRTLEGHSGKANSVAFSHDSAWLASGSYYGTVKIWDTSSGECFQTLEGHSAEVHSIAFSHDSAWLASGSCDGTVKIWDASNGECFRTLEGHSGNVSSVAFSYDSTWLVSGSYDGAVKIWDASNGECLQTLEGHSGWVNSVAFSHDSAWLASGSQDETVKIWDGSGECFRTLEGHSSKVSSVAFSHDSAWLASGSWDGTVRIWDASNAECLRTLEGHITKVSLVAFSHDSAWLASGSWGGVVKIWDASSGECLQTLEGHAWVTLVTFSHDSTRIASASRDKTAKIWDTSSGDCLQTFEGHSDWVTSVAFSHDSTRIASASDDKTVKIWDASNGECLRTLEGHSGNVSSVAFSHDSAWLASGSWDRTVKIWDTSNGECLQTLQTGKAFYNISFDITSSYLYTEIGTIKIRTLSGSRMLPTNLEPKSPQYQGLALSADGIWITHDSENLVWLPSEYRPLCSAVSRNTIGVGVGTGRVWICKLKPGVF